MSQQKHKTSRLDMYALEDPCSSKMTFCPTCMTSDILEFPVPVLLRDGTYKVFGSDGIQSLQKQFPRENLAN